CKHPDTEIFSKSEIPNSFHNRGLTNDYLNGEVVKMIEQDGVRYVKVEINGKPLNFVFDTGASNICMSLKEAKNLYQNGLIDVKDFKGMNSFQDATGAVSNGLIVNLKSVKLGGVELKNVNCLIVESESAPLLLGQSFLEKIGNIEIDNINNFIILK
ncbi:retroviral-like aspartic protease family protein, partial [Ornithobacterium rhinotracheale]|uniref:retropepsin-like aspartic protease family protein n=1 Tax=Ornithobacterium rhinotracheale TaxID=28251 RepID=UPI001FF6AB25